MTSTLPSISGLRPQRLDRRTILIGAAVLALAGAIVFAPAIAHEGFYADDWENGATSVYYYEHGALGPFRIPFHEPVLGLLLPLPHLLFGVRPGWHLALALVLGVGASLTFVALLVRLGLSRFDAIAIATLALLCPFSDSLRVWSTAGLDSVAVMLCFGGLAGGIDRLRGSEGFLARRYRWLLAASVLTYTAVAPVCLLTGPIYGLAGVTSSRARAVWRGDAWRMLPLVAYVAVVTTKQHLGPGGAFSHAAQIARDGATVVGRALLPIDGIAYWLVAAIAAALVAAVAIVVRSRAPRPGPRAALAGRWLSIAVISVIAVTACWLPYASAADFYHPLAPGILNRVNVVAAFPIAALVYALAAVLVSPLRRVSPALIGLAVAIGWAVWIRRDIHHYVMATRAQEVVLAQVHSLPIDQQSLSVFVGGYRLTTAPQVPVFIGSWDLDGAVKLTLQDGHAVGQPLRTAATLVCGRTAAVPDDTHVNRLAPQPYEDLILLNVATDRWVRVRDQHECLTGAARLGFRARPGVPVPRDNQGRPTDHVDA